MKKKIKYFLGTKPLKSASLHYRSILVFIQKSKRYFPQEKNCLKRKMFVNLAVFIKQKNHTPKQLRPSSFPSYALGHYAFLNTHKHTRINTQTANTDRHTNMHSKK